MSTVLEVDLGASVAFGKHSPEELQTKVFEGVQVQAAGSPSVVASRFAEVYECVEADTDHVETKLVAMQNCIAAQVHFETG